jgi:hypothetical protein
VKAPIQKVKGSPLRPQILKNSYLALRSVNQFAKGLFEKYANDQALGI